MTRVFAMLLVAIVLVGASPTSRPKPSVVTIKSMKFDPATIHIKTGQTVTWLNADDRDHTVSSDDGKSFSSGNIKKGQTFDQKFPKAGTFPYACSYHPRMRATVVVKD